MSVPPGLESIIIQSPTISTVTVVTDRGPAGQRGSFIYSAVGHPSQFVSNNGETYYMFGDTSKYLGLDDLYLDEATNRIYRWSAGPGTHYWQDTSAGANIYEMGTSQIDFANAAIQTYSVTTTSTFTTTNLREGGYVKLILTAGASGPYTLNWPGTWKWSGTAPTSLASNAVRIIDLISTTTADSGVYAS